MKEIPAIVEELRNCDAYNLNQTQEDHKIKKNEILKKEKQDGLTTDDSLDDLWFDMWKVL